MNKFWIIFAGLTCIFISCDKDETENNISFSKGIFVVNQGVFQNGTGTITYRNESDNNLLQDVFETKNEGKVLGNIAQSMIKFDNKYFIAVNNAAKIQVVNASDFKSIGEITIDLPRYFVTDGQKLYVSSWGNDYKSGVIHEINAVNLSISPPIHVGNAPETMLFSEDKLYITVSSPYGLSSQTVAVIDTKTNKVVKSIQTGDSPVSIVKDINDDIWILCTGNYDPDPTKFTKGSLHRLSNDLKMNSFILSTGATGLITDSDGDRLYFLMDGKVMAHDINDQTFENESVYDGYFNCIHYQNSTHRIFLGQGSFTAQGEVLFINPETQGTGRFATGIGPGFIYFSE
ncbi:MAG: hypothetical protein H7X99_02055 [Saprospiraceae bacterium]|nr:hypothetical protein [Saprospiraceae bacterium]